MSDVGLLILRVDYRGYEEETSLQGRFEGRDPTQKN